MNKPDIRSLTLAEVADYCLRQGEASFRAQQIFEGIYKKGAENFEAIKGLSQGLRQKLVEDFDFTKMIVVKDVQSSDGTRKFLFSLNDGKKIETVLIPAKNRNTVCLSTQVGCKFGCTFCASGLGGWKRNLTSGEILSQILTIQKISSAKITHLVYMGTGEPLDNYENVLKSIRLANAPEGLGIGARHITISTSGIIPQIKRLAGEGLQIELAVSLHGYDDCSRNTLMPVNKKYPIGELAQACREYAQATKRQITFEYILINGVTCAPQAAPALARLLK